MGRLLGHPSLLLLQLFLYQAVLTAVKGREPVAPPLPLHGCRFNGEYYGPGATINNICIDMTCRLGQWVTNGYINGLCGECYVRDDPHFTSFDDVSFDYHGPCNYTLTQKDHSYDPPFGVFSQFWECSSSVTCLKDTTFKDNLFTAIRMDVSMSSYITVNNYGYPVTSTMVQPARSQDPLGVFVEHPVLVWKYENCVRLLGSQGLLVQYCWFGTSWPWSQIRIWAYPSLSEQLNGLCGHFNHIYSDDLTHRFGGLITPPPPGSTGQPNDFGDTWKTIDQTVDKCVKQISVTTTDIAKGDCPTKNFKRHMRECKELLGKVTMGRMNLNDKHFEVQAEFCAEDLCAFARSKVPAKEVVAFKEVMKDMLLMKIEIDAMTIAVEELP